MLLTTVAVVVSGRASRTTDSAQSSMRSSQPSRTTMRSCVT